MDDENRAGSSAADRKVKATTAPIPGIVINNRHTASSFASNRTTGRPFDFEIQRGDEVVPVVASGCLMVNDTGSLLGACLGGTGVAQLLEIYARDFSARGRLVHLLPDWDVEAFPLHAFHHSSTLVSAKVRAFLDSIRAWRHSWTFVRSEI
ncbi:MAG: LysR substrate-binding domain-containing protein [Shinella sp.]|nr:LysR substrate-binding domain-containing protein [Shinella sp.]